MKNMFSSSCNIDFRGEIVCKFFSFRRNRCARVYILTLDLIGILARVNGVSDFLFWCDYDDEDDDRHARVWWCVYLTSEKLAVLHIGMHILLGK